MNRFWSPLVASLEPYVPGEQPKIRDLIKLNTNENPYGPSPRALEAVRLAADDAIRLYPDPETTDLKRAIADFYGLGVSNVFVGNGSDEVLAHVFRALLGHRGPVLFPDISYSFYPVYCRLLDLQYETVPLSGQFDIEVEAYRDGNGGIIFPNPNAPTGKLLPISSIARCLERHRESVVVVDEAYIDFGGESAVPLVRKYPNLLVVQTFSKSRSLAGLRVGFAIGHEGLVEALERVKNSFNSYPLDRLAQVGAAASMRDVDYFEETRRRVIATREDMKKGLETLGFEVLPSAANFVFARHPQLRGADLAAALRQRSIIVRHFEKPRIADFLRISVGTDWDGETLLKALAEILQGSAR